MNVFKSLLSTKGRLSREGYVLCFVLPGAALLALSVAAFTVAPQLLSGPIMQAIVMGWAVYLSTGDAQNIRRYHDLGNSGGLYNVLRPFLVILPLIAFAIQFMIPAQLASAGDTDALVFLMGQEVAFHMSPVPLAVMVLWGVGILANTAYLAITPGDAGPNTFGSDPKSGGGAPLPAADADPVERTLAEYRAGLAQAAHQAKSTRTAAAAPRPAGTFGRKR